MNRRLLLQAVVALTVFAIWTSIVRVGIPGSRHSVWIIQPFGKWPAEVHDVRRTSDAELSMFASYAPSDATTRGRGPIPELFGEPVVGTVVDSDDSENINGSRFTTGIGGGTVLSISAFVAGPVGEPPHDQFQLAVYSDADGAPSRRLAATPTGRLQPDAWNTLPVRVVVQPRTSYWLMYNTNGTSPSVNNLMYTRIVGNPLDNAIQSHLTARLAQQGDRITAVADLGPMVAAIILIGLVATRRRRRRHRFARRLRAGPADRLGTPRDDLRSVRRRVSQRPRIARFIRGLRLLPGGSGACRPSRSVCVRSAHLRRHRLHRAPLFGGGHRRHASRLGVRDGGNGCGRRSAR